MSILNLFANSKVQAAADKFQSFLDHSSNGVVFYDQHLEATHASQTAVQLFEKFRSAFAADAPGVDLTRIAGCKLSAFSLIPQAVLDALASNKGWTRMLTFGAEKFHFTLTPFLDKQNHFDGCMLEFWWATEYQKMEVESQRSASVLREMSIPIITCDNNRVITSLNPSVFNLLSKHKPGLQKVFPSFDPEKLIGRTIDEFHQNPEMQKRIFADPNLQMPYKARIKILDMYFDLSVFPTKDGKGKITGYAVEWIDSTSEVNTIKQIESVAEHIVAGQLNERIDLTSFSSELLPLGEGVNKMLEAIVQPLNVAADYVDRIAKGAIPPKITDNYNGDFNVIKNNLNTCIDAVNTLVADAVMLSQAAVEGKLSTRADATQHQGDYRKIVQGVNNTLDAVIGPLNVAAAYVDNISKGEIPTKITDNYNGDFNILKINLNTCIAAIDNLVADANMLASAALEGRLQTRADANKHQGDFRKIVVGVNDTLDAVIEPLNESIEVLSLLEQGDLTHTMTGDYKGQLGEFKTTLNNTINKLSQTIAEVVSSADQLGNASEQISATSQSLSQASSEQASSVEETTSSIEQMAASINQNAENAKITDGMAGKASREASEGGLAVKQTVDAMKEIANKIGIIDDIAYQTNMLALNAAIEAARAGDHGKGFAVVAAEVRKLAERSQVAAQEIGELAETSVRTAESAGKLLDAIVPSIGKTSDLVQEISAASQEQSAGVGMVNNAMNQMNQITQQNASASEELAATAEEMTSQVEQLQSMMNFFKISGNDTVSYAPSIKKVSKKPIKAQTTLQVNRPNAKPEFDLNSFERF